MKLMFTSLAAALALAAAGASAQDLAEHASVYKGPQGLEAVVAPTKDNKNALVRLSGINHPIDGVVFLAETSVQGQSTYYQVPVGGRVLSLVFTNEGGRWGQGYSETFAKIPDVRDPVAVGYDEKASKSLNRDSLLATYRKQNGEQVQEKLGKLDRPKAVASSEASIKESDALATEACGVPVKTTVDWSSVTDDMVTRLSISSFCSTPADALRFNCGSEASIKAGAAKFATIHCAFGDKLRLQLQDGKVVFTTEEKAPNQRDFVTQFLRNQ